MEEQICKVEGCTNRVLKRGKKSAATTATDAASGKNKNDSVGIDNNQGSTVVVEEEKEEEYCKRHAVKKIDDEGHILCSERWCRNKVGSDQSVGEGDIKKQPCCEKGDEAVPLCTKHCLSSHHVDCGEECTSSVHDHEHHHHDGGEKKNKKGEIKAANKEKEGGDHHKGGVDVMEQELGAWTRVGECGHDHDHGHHHHHDHEEKEEDDDDKVSASEEAVARPKKPLNAYMRYVAEVRGDLTKEFPDLSFKELVS